MTLDTLTMKKTIRLVLIVAAAGLLAVAGTGCSAKARRARTLAKADRYLAAGQYDQAEIEYLNVLKGDGGNARAISRLGSLYFDQGRLSRAAPFLLKANQLLPDDLDTRVKLGLLYTAVGQMAKARAEAEFVLARRPMDAEAPLLLAETTANDREIVAARRLLGSLPAPAPGSPPVLVALGTLEVRQRHVKEAEAAFIRAQTIDPKYDAAWAALGGLRIVQNDRVSADQALKQAADLAPPRSIRRLQYARFKIQCGDLKSGRSLLEEITRNTPDYLPAWIRLAELAMQEKRYDDGLAAVGRVLTRDPLNPEAMLLSGQLRLAKGEPDKAVEDLEKMQAVYPRSPQTDYQLGLAFVAKGDAGKAIDAFNHALSLAPDFIEARYMLAELSIRKGDLGTAIVALKKVLEQRPGLLQPWILLADAYRAQGNFSDALAVYRRLEAANPKSPLAPLLSGLVLEQQGQLAEARQAFTRAIELAPDSLQALEQLVDLDVRAKEYPAALQRVQSRLAQNPKDAGLQLLLAKIYLAQRDTAQAEAALRKAIELKPDSPTGYLLLARLYLGTDQQEKALANLAEVVAKNPKDAGALMLIGMIHDTQKNYPAARDAYEKVLAINPNFGAAMNNLAYLYSQHLNQPERAFELAQKARELQPDEPHTADTFGWILSRRHQYPWALTLLQEAAAKLSTEPEVQYHLGMTHYLMGEEAPARLALQRALQLSGSFQGADEARQCLSILEIDVPRIAATARPDLEKMLAGRPDDPVALARLAALYEQDGAADKAIDAWQRAVKGGSANVNALMNLARLHAAHGEPALALEEAKAARKLAPDDPGVGYALGRLALQAGDRAWGASVLQQAADRRPDDPAIQCDLAQALYSVGRVAAAETAMHRAVDLAAGGGPAAADGGAGQPFARLDEARRFLDMAALAADPAQAAAAADRIDAALKADPADVPALMAKAAADEQRADLASARRGYGLALARYPDFVPAKRRLAILDAESGSDQQKIYDWALSARQAYPGDADVAKALGIISYRRGEFARAEPLLRESLVARTADAELMYYLGMAQDRMQQRARAKETLQRALALNLRSDLAQEARRALAAQK